MSSYIIKDKLFGSHSLKKITFYINVESNQAEKNDSTELLANYTQLIGTKEIKFIDLNHRQSYDWLASLFDLKATQLTTNSNIQILKLNEFDAEFLKTCTPCIMFCLAHVVTTLPYSLIEFTNQFWPNIMLVNVTQYLTYTRYLFYGSKFYILYVVSFKFRKQFKVFWKRSLIKRWIAISNGKNKKKTSTNLKQMKKHQQI